MLVTLWERLLARLAELPFDVIAALTAVATRTQWPAGHLFLEAEARALDAPSSAQEATYRTPAMGRDALWAFHRGFDAASVVLPSSSRTVCPPPVATRTGLAFATICLSNSKRCSISRTGASKSTLPLTVRWAERLCVQTAHHHVHLPQSPARSTVHDSNSCSYPG